MNSHRFAVRLVWWPILVCVCVLLVVFVMLTLIYRWLINCERKKNDFLSNHSDNDKHTTGIRNFISDAIVSAFFPNAFFTFTQMKMIRACGGWRGRGRQSRFSFSADNFTVFILKECRRKWWRLMRLMVWLVLASFSRNWIQLFVRFDGTKEENWLKLETIK